MLIFTDDVWRRRRRRSNFGRVLVVNNPSAWIQLRRKYLFLAFRGKCSTPLQGQSNTAHHVKGIVQL
jgi:hypothetical protein